MGNGNIASRHDLVSFVSFQFVEILLAFRGWSFFNGHPYPSLWTPYASDSPPPLV